MMVLLHTCCGPCASACCPRLVRGGDRPVMFFSNSNIATEEEFEKRLEAARTLGKADGVEVVADVYDHEDWLEKVARGLEDEPERGARCAKCFRYSLERTARYAAEHGLTLSLRLSRYRRTRYRKWSSPRDEMRHGPFPRLHAEVPPLRRRNFSRSTSRSRTVFSSRCAEAGNSACTARNSAVANSRATIEKTIRPAARRTTHRRFRPVA